MSTLLPPGPVPAASHRRPTARQASRAAARGATVRSAPTCAFIAQIMCDQSRLSSGTLGTKCRRVGRRGPQPSWRRSQPPSPPHGTGVHYEEAHPCRRRCSEPGRRVRVRAPDGGQFSRPGDVGSGLQQRLRGWLIRSRGNSESLTDAEGVGLRPAPCVCTLVRRFHGTTVSPGVRALCASGASIRPSLLVGSIAKKIFLTRMTEDARGTRG
jgi:hypothetical protein